MKRTAIPLLRLYPKAWRERYGEEIGGLIEDTPVRWQMLPDLARGAMKEQFNMQSFARLAGWFSAAGLAAGFLASFAVTPRYTSQALISMNTPGASGILRAAQAELMSRSRLADIINNPRLKLYEDEKKRIPMEDVEDQMRHDLILTAAPTKDPDSAVAAIAFTCRDPVRAKVATADIIDTLIYVIQMDFNREYSAETALDDHDRKYLDEIGRLESAIARLEKRSLSVLTAPPRPSAAQLIKVLDAPSLPAHPISPNRAAYAACGLGGGIVAAFVVALFRRRPRLAPDPVVLS